MDDNRYWELLSKFHEGQTTREENEELAQLMADAGEVGFDDFAREFWNEGEELESGQKERLTADMLERIRIYEEKRPGRRRRTIHWIAGSLAVAASLVLAVLAGFQLSEYRQENQWFEVICENGQKSTLTLPDGSVVHLNSSSHLTYNTADRLTRNVQLTGEAYFDVAHDASRPFIVEAGDMKVKVLGTEFNVKAYENDASIETTLVEGKVLATVNGIEEVLLPNERLSYNKTSGTMEKMDHLEDSRLVPWLDNEIFFQHDSLKQIAVLLERMYAIEVHFADPAIENYSYTGHIRNTSLMNILELITSTSSLRYEMNGNVLTFKKQ